MALAHFLLADTYPSNQGIGRLSNYQKEAQIFYFTGLAHLGLKDINTAKSFFRKAAGIPVGNSEYLYYRALAQQELGQDEEAMASAQQLIQAGGEALEKARATDFFAKFGEKEGLDSRKAASHYLMALGYHASGDDEKAQEAFEQALELRNSILWASIYAND